MNTFQGQRTQLEEIYLRVSSIFSIVVVIDSERVVGDCLVVFVVKFNVAKGLLKCIEENYTTL